MDEKVKITVEMPRELRDEAKRKAKAEDITISQLVRRCLRDWVTEEPSPEAEEQEKTTA